MKPLTLTILSAFLVFNTVSAFAEIAVLKVSGTAAYRDGKKWVPLKAGMKLPEGVKVSTGANSSTELRVNSINHTVIIKPLTMIQVFSKETKNSTDTHIGLKRGGITAKVPRDARVKTVFKVSTPIATSSVRGTEEDISYGPGSGMMIYDVRSLVEAKNRLGRSNFVSGRLKYVQQLNLPKSLNIANDMRGRSLVAVYGNGITGDESDAMLYSGGDQTGGPEDDAGILNSQMQQDAKVRLNITWP
jgi:hypothetical protein